MSILIALDAGHGNNTPGKRTPKFSDGSYMKENEFNKGTVKYLKTMLERCGFRTLDVAPEASDTPLNVRTKRANDANANLYVSVHANAYGSSVWNSANGIETWVDEKEGKTLQVALKVQNEMIIATKLKDRGVKESNGSLAVLRDTKMYAILVECGFMTNKWEAMLLKSEDYRKKCAEAICKGICKFYGVAYIAETKEDDEVIEKAKIIVEGEEIDIERILKDGINFVKLRDLAEIFGYDISFEGSTAILTKKAS